MSTYIHCPKCGDERRKIGTRSLSVTERDDGRYSVKCFHGASCEWNSPAIVTAEDLGDVDVDAKPRQAAVGEPIPENLIPQDSAGKTYYRYYDRDLNIKALILRLDKPEGKEIYPVYYDGTSLQFGFPEGKYLYNAPMLIKYPDLPVAIVEGEKAAEAAQDAVLKGFLEVIITTWPLGSKNYLKGDWELLKGREVLLWPDNDDAGKQAMHKIYSILQEQR